MPYAFEDNIKHFCLWKIGGEITENDINTTIESMKLNFKYTDIIYWENPQNLKSIPGVEYIHIVIKV